MTIKLQQYAKENNLTKEEYKQLKANIKALALATIENIKQLHKTDTGVYYNTNEIINHGSNSHMKQFLISELKNLGVEFIENNTLYRY